MRTGSDTVAGRRVLVVEDDFVIANVIAEAFQARRDWADALYVCTDAALIHTNRIQINAAALMAAIAKVSALVAVCIAEIDGTQLLEHG